MLNCVIAFWVAIVGFATFFYRKYFMDSNSYGKVENAIAEYLSDDGSYTLSSSTMTNYVRLVNIVCPVKLAGTSSWLLITLADKNEGMLDG